MKKEELPKIINLSSERNLINKISPVQKPSRENSKIPTNDGHKEKEWSIERTEKATIKTFWAKPLISAFFSNVLNRFDFDQAVLIIQYQQLYSNKFLLFFFSYVFFLWLISNLMTIDGKSFNSNFKYTSCMGNKVADSICYYLLQ